MVTVNQGNRPVAGDILDDPDDPIVEVRAGWYGDDYREPPLEAWLRHCKWAIGRNPKPKRLAQALKEWPILKDAREFLSADDYVALVSTLNPVWRNGLRVGVTDKAR